jgi:hypothetical protein
MLILFPEKVLRGKNGYGHTALKPVDLKAVKAAWSPVPEAGNSSPRISSTQGNCDIISICKLKRGSSNE